MEKTITIKKSDIEKMIEDIKNSPIRRCIWCKVGKNTAELRGIKCKTRNMLGVKVKRHVFKIVKE